MKAHVPVLISVLALVMGGLVAAPAASALNVGAASAAATVAPAVAGSVVSVTPSRIADSRTRLQIPGAVPAQGTAAVEITGRGGIPGSGVAAVIATVTVVGPQSVGYVTVWPSGTALPGTSNLNFTAGQTVANTVVVRLGDDGRILVFNGSPGTVQLILDVTGYVRSGTSTAAGALAMLTPARIVDSRYSLQLVAVPALADVTVQIGGEGGVPPAGVAGVVATVTAVDPQSAGHLTLWPSYTAMPGTSNLNFQAGQTIAATVIVPVSSNLSVRLYNGSASPVQVIVDVSGYILSGTPAAAGTIGPATARIADSRPGLQIPDAVTALGTTAVQVAAPGSGVGAAVATVTVVDPRADGHVTVWRSGASLPGTSNLNFQAGQTIATTMVVPIGSDGKIQLFNGSPANLQVVVDITGYTLTGADVHGAVQSWGGGEMGQLGNGSGSNSWLPVPVFGLTHVTAVAGGGLAGYALRGDGTVWSWGYGSFGQRGTGACCAMVSPVPLQIPGLSNITGIAAGAGTGYALRNDGTVWSWGDGSSGALGDGDDETYSTVPVQVSGLMGVTAIAAGNSTGYALDTDGRIWAWGAGDVGQLGNGGTANGLPGLVADPRHITAIAAGGNTGYGLSDDGLVRAWGDGSWGQMGDGVGGPSYRHLLPIDVPGLTSVTAIAAATFTGYALRSDGTVFAWGEGHYGELGDGTTTTISAGPVQASVPTGITAIAAGGFNGYALRDDGNAWAWGQGLFGQLGTGSEDGRLPAAVIGPTSVTAIAGGRYTAYAVTE